MSRTGLYSLVILLLLVLAGVGVYAYQQSQRPVLEVKVDGSGIKINGSGG